MKKTILWLLGACFVLLVFLAVLVVSASWIINRPVVKERIVATASQALGGQVADELKGMMKRILSLPFTLISPVLPKAKPANQQDP